MWKIFKYTESVYHSLVDAMDAIEHMRHGDVGQVRYQVESEVGCNERGAFYVTRAECVNTVRTFAEADNYLLLLCEDLPLDESVFIELA